MDVVWNRKLGEHVLVIKDEAGQSTVEYIMLLGVVFLLLLTVIKNERFKDLVGPDSEIVGGMRDSMMYTYRHGRAGKASEDSSTYTDKHETFTNSDGSGSRFFSNDEEYPAP